MAENLYNNVMAFTGRLPWHRLGVQFEKEFTSAEAIEAAQLDYIVDKERLYRFLDGGMAREVDAYATINRTTQDVLGIVGSGYEVLQNTEAFDFFDILLKESGGKLQTAGAIGKGEKVWMMAKLPQTFVPIAGDSIEQYLLGTTSHDGTMKTEVRFTPIRVVCQNTFNMAIRKSDSVISIRHTTNMRQKLEIAAIILLRYKEFFDVMGDKFNKLANIKIDDRWLDEYMSAVIGNPKKISDGRAKTIMENKIQLVKNRLECGMGTEIPGVVGTAWWALNGMVEFADYDMKTRGQDKDLTKRTHSILFGVASDFKQKAFDSVLEMARIA